MIRETVQYINLLVDTLNLFQQKFELVEKVKKEDQVFPAEFCTTEYNQINFDFDKSTSYHRQNGQVQREIETDQESPTGCAENISQRYPMRFVGVFPRNIYETSDRYIDEKIANNLVSVLEKPNVKSLSVSLKLDSLAIRVTGYSIDKMEVWGEEYTNVDFKMPSDWGMIAIDYEIEAVGLPSCFDVVGCNDADIDWLARLKQDICTPVIVSNSDDSYSVETAVNLELPDITVSNSNNSYSVTSPSVKNVGVPDTNISNSDDSFDTDIPSVTAYELADVTHTDSDGSPVVYPSAKPFVCTPAGAISGLTCAQLNSGLTQAQRQLIQRVNLLKTGQTTSYAVGDDGDLEEGRGVNFFTLDCNNSFGNTNRFTNSIGGSVNDGSDGSITDYIIDHQTGMGWFRTVNGAQTWANAISGANGSVLGGFSDWRLPNRVELMSIFNIEQNDFNYAPLSINLSPPIFLWTSSTKGNQTTIAWTFLANSSNNFGIIGALGKTSTANFIICRNHY